MRSALALALLLSACSGTPDEAGDGGYDGGHDAGRDASVTTDSGHDAGFDGGQDSGPTCACSTGACCDGCNFRPASYVCQDIVSSGCTGDSLCSMKPRVAHVAHNLMYCSGSGASCLGVQMSTNAMTDCRVPNGVDFLTYGRCDPAGVAHCVDGPDCVTVYP
jgi:hypothetical protein